MLIFQKGFNFSQDGPGNRLVLHLQGCNFTCPWCSNPEGMGRTGDADNYSPEQLYELALRSRPLFFDGGGVTFTGGECTLQHDELLRLLKLLRGGGISACIETNASDERLDELLPYIDYLIADLKHVDDSVHKRFIGVSNETVIRNISAILGSGRQLLIRIPLINGFNSDPAPFVEFFSGHDASHAQIEALRYHEYGKSKWKTEYKFRDGFVDDKVYGNFVEALTQIGLKVINT